MNIFPFHPRNQRGYALMMVLVITGISLLILGSALNWSSNNAVHIQRYVQYYNTLAAAEAATEKVLADMIPTYQKEGEGEVYTRMSTYASWVPTSAEDPLWSDYAFSDGAHNADHTFVDRITRPAFTNLFGQFSGLYGMAATYRVISNARQISSPYPITVALKQDVQVSTIPLFQFAIFYSMDMEVNPGKDMNITGRVHGNANIYTTTSANLHYQSDVTAVGNLFRYRLDNTNTTGGNVFFDKGDAQVHYNSLSLPIGTNNTSTAVREILNIPPGWEDRNGPMGTNRYYNKADLIIVITPTNTVKVTSGSINSFGTTLTNEWTNFVTTNLSFYDQREGKTMKGTQIDISKLKTWSTTNASIRNVISRDINSVYVADLRTNSPSSTEYAVRVTNGATLPSQGLTVATPNPLYVLGNYNAPTAYLGTSNTTTTLPASLVGDAITILSGAWNDANGNSGISSRIASSTTVNAAIVAGIVRTQGSSYSGGVENFPRFLENWDNKTLTYNGSMVVMFESQIADAPWPNTGTVYNPPARNWAFDLNFMDPTKLPPGTPSARDVVRFVWTTIPKDTTQ